ncbi:CLUMA_CG015606, isoform A [Clunio marinus]|uniref:CLUMA_CG015606, isoform A n=1 Tax=Clunio marinus TaxID=568069 RepID=A0A1J1ISC1_9DIPT|nr:CLUMA_CG015606, isoform A [Clunio marinus]
MKLIVNAMGLGKLGLEKREDFKSISSSARRSFSNSINQHRSTLSVDDLHKNLFPTWKDFNSTEVQTSNNFQGHEISLSALLSQAILMHFKCINSAIKIVVQDRIQ